MRQPMDCQLTSSSHSQALHGPARSIDLNIHAAKLIYFSPTQTTRKVIEGIVHGMRVDRVDAFDLTQPEARTQHSEEVCGDLAIIGAPVYGGRIPMEAVRRLRRLKGRGTPAAVVVVYGNRACEDALLELADLAVEGGFVPIAGGAYVGEHSFSSEATPIAHRRPDAEDLRRAAEFGHKIQEKMRGIRSRDALLPVYVPGRFPYRWREEPFHASPVTREALCTRCGTCAAACPTVAIAIGDAVATDRATCILCCACVKNCPTGARAVEDPRVGRSVMWLAQACRKRREPEVYL